MHCLYKRAAIEELELLVKTRIEAVSDTHLDVYKRQRLCRVPS